MKPGKKVSRETTALLVETVNGGFQPEQFQPAAPASSVRVQGGSLLPVSWWYC
jgi:hypothetical protein